MKKSFPFFCCGIVSFMVIFLFNGCVNYEQRTIINNDGSGSMKVSYNTKMSNLEFEDEIGRLGFSEALVREKFRSDNITIKSIDISETLFDSVRHVNIEIDFNDIKRLTLSEAFSNIRIDYNSNSDEIDFSYTVPMDTNTAYNFDAVKSTLDYEFELPPGEVICTNGKVSGNKIIFSRRASDLYDDIEMFAKIRRK